MQAKQGDKVKIHYTGKLEDGDIFASSKNKEPIEFTLGQGQVIPGIEEAVEGMETGESKTVNIPPDKAYGPHRDELTQEIPKKEMPGDIKPQVGQRLNVKWSDGKETPVSVTDVSETSVIIDANHPLAGKDIVFELELVGIS
jgi:peptidylprolyl isomerase